MRPERPKPLEDHMKTLELALLSLLSGDKVLTISRTEEGWLLTHADVEVEGSEIYFVPSSVIASEGTLSEAISQFDIQQSLMAIGGFHA